MAAIFLLLLLALALSLIIDIDRPTLGGIVEAQGPMEALRKSMAGTPTQVYDKWKVRPRRRPRSAPTPSHGPCRGIRPTLQGPCGRSWPAVEA